MPEWESWAAGMVDLVGDRGGRIKMLCREDMRVVKRWKVSASAWAEFPSNSSCARTYPKSALCRYRQRREWG
jgi:hypothetical protein